MQVNYYRIELYDDYENADAGKIMYKCYYVGMDYPDMNYDVFAADSREFAEILNDINNFAEKANLLYYKHVI